MTYLGRATLRGLGPPIDVRNYDGDPKIGNQRSPVQPPFTLEIEVKCLKVITDARSLARDAITPLLISAKFDAHSGTRVYY